MVARIATEPTAASLAISGYRSRAGSADVQDVATTTHDELLPPVPAPVPTPVPGPVIVSPTQAFTAALIAQELPDQSPSAAEIKLLQPDTWQPPASSLSLMDLQV